MTEGKTMDQNRIIDLTARLGAWCQNERRKGATEADLEMALLHCWQVYGPEQPPFTREEVEAANAPTA